MKCIRHSSITCEETSRGLLDKAQVTLLEASDTMPRLDKTAYEVLNVTECGFGVLGTTLTASIRFRHYATIDTAHS